MLRDLLSLSVRCDADAPGLVRAALARTELQDLGWILGDAMLVASELVTNAVRHSGCTEKDDLVVSVVANGSLRITVADPGGSGRRADIAQREIGSGGLGLLVVEQLAKAWGSERRADGHLVWAALPAASTEESAGPRSAGPSEHQDQSATSAEGQFRRPGPRPDPPLSA